MAKKQQPSAEMNPKTETEWHKPLVGYRNNYLEKKPSQKACVSAFDWLMFKAGVLKKFDLGREPLPIEEDQIGTPKKNKASELLEMANGLFREYKTNLSQFVLTLVGIPNEELMAGTAFKTAKKIFKGNPDAVAMKDEAALPSAVVMQMKLEGIVAEEPGIALHAFDLIPIAEKDGEFAGLYAQKEWTLERLFDACATRLQKEATGTRGPMAFSSEHVDSILVELVTKEVPGKASGILTMKTPSEPQAVKPAGGPALGKTELEKIKAKAYADAKKEASERVKAEREAAKAKKEADKARKAEEARKAKEEAEKAKRPFQQMSLFDFVEGGSSDAQ